jgi:hypothetical protein
MSTISGIFWEKLRNTTKKIRVKIADPEDENRLQDVPNSKQER